ncbi:MAG: BON domain-containing protein [Gemmatimonadetes bacterium]|nr:BON domain-containing protein [Gemmatimonadota bacterium]
MARYIEDESDSGHTLLVAAGVVAGLLAGAVVAQRMGGWRGMRRLLGKQRAPLLKLVRGALPSGALGAVIDAVGIEQIIGALLGTVPAERRPVAAKKRRRQRTRDLDEYEVDDIERAAAGLDDDDEESAPPARAHVGDDAFPDDDDDEDEDAEDDIVDPESPEAIEEAVLAAFRRHAVLRQRALEIAVDDDGVLELTGRVRTERELRIARRVASRVEGVERVVVDVAVRDAGRGAVRAGARTGSDAP